MKRREDTDLMVAEPLVHKTGETIKKLMLQKNVTMTSLHKLTGVPITTINRLVNDTHINPTISSVLPLANFFNVTLNQIMGIDPLDCDTKWGAYAKKNTTWTRIPVLTWEEVIHWPANIEAVNPSKVISVDTETSETAFALIVDQDNNEGIFLNSILVVDPILKPKNRDYAITVKKGQHRASLKQILIEDDSIYLRPLNKDFQTVVMDENYDILGVVFQIRTKRA